MDHVSEHDRDGMHRVSGLCRFAHDSYSGSDMMQTEKIKFPKRENVRSKHETAIYGVNHETLHRQ